MRGTGSLLVRAAIFAASLSGPAFSQGAPQTVTLMKVDPTTLAIGYLTSKAVGIFRTYPLSMDAAIL